MTSAERQELQARARGILFDTGGSRRRDIYVLSNRGSNRLTHQKLQHDSESEGECDGNVADGENGESGSQPILFKKDTRETSLNYHPPLSPTMQASSGESS